MVPDSQVTEPPLETLMNLYSNLVPGAMEVVSLQSAFRDGWVSVRAAAGAHEPSCAIEPTTLMTSPLPVFAVSTKVTATAVLAGVGAAVVGEDVVVGMELLAEDDAVVVKMTADMELLADKAVAVNNARASCGPTDAENVPDAETT